MAAEHRPILMVQIDQKMVQPIHTHTHATHTTGNTRNHDNHNGTSASSTIHDINGSTAATVRYEVASSLRRSTDSPTSAANNDDAIVHLRANVALDGFARRFRVAIIGIVLLFIGIVVALFMIPAHFAGWQYGVLCLAIGMCVCCCPLIMKCCSISRMATTEFALGPPSIKSLATYQDANLLRAAFAISPYRQSCIFYQPIEGYCGTATVNTMLWSITNNEPQHCFMMAPYPRPYTLYSLHNYIDKEIIPRAPIERIDVISGALQHDEFINVLMTANGTNSRIRLLCNFHRSPLFFTHLPTIPRWKKCFSGHWSPIGSYLVQEDLVMMLDVNRSYGSYLVPSHRLWQSIHTRDFGDGQFRGLIRIVLKP